MADRSARSRGLPLMPAALTGRDSPPCKEADRVPAKLAILLTCLSCMAMLNCGAAERTESRPPEADVVSVHADPNLRQTTYSIAQGTCRIRWVVYSSESNRGVIHRR